MRFGDPGARGTGPRARPTGVAVVTGASRGLGAALALELAGRGFALGLCATSEPVLPGALCRAVDVADAHALDRFAAEVADRLGPIDLWVNNAAVLGPTGALRSTEPAAWERCIAVNLIGVVNGTRSFLTHRAARQAVLVNVASRAGMAGLAGLGAYSATKGAVIALTASVAEEERGSGLRAFAVVPPSIDTDMQATLLSMDEREFPLVARWRQRQRDGGVVAPEAAAERIVSEVLRDDRSEALVDLRE